MTDKGGGVLSVFVSAVRGKEGNCGGHVASVPVGEVAFYDVYGIGVCVYGVAGSVGDVGVGGANAEISRSSWRSPRREYFSSDATKGKAIESVALAYKR